MKVAERGIIIIITNEKIKVMLSRNAAGALYKIITRDTLVNVSQNYGRIEMSSAGNGKSNSDEEFWVM